MRKSLFGSLLDNLPELLYWAGFIWAIHKGDVLFTLVMAVLVLFATIQSATDRIIRAINTKDRTHA